MIVIYEKAIHVERALPEVCLDTMRLTPTNAVWREIYAWI